MIVKLILVVCSVVCIFEVFVSEPQPALVPSVLCETWCELVVAHLHSIAREHIKIDRETDHDETHCGVGPVAVQLPRLVHLRWCCLDYRPM